MRAALFVGESRCLAIDVEAGAVAVVQRIGAERCDLGNRCEMGALQRFPEDLSFDFELLRVGGVLVVASAAFSEVPAGGGYARGRCFEDAVEFGFGVASAIVYDLCLDDFAGQREGNEDRFAFGACEAGSSVDAL